MGDLILEKEVGTGVTIISNSFLDEYMPNATGEFVKIYLYLVRCFSDNNCQITLYNIADKFNHTEKDVNRALLYWERLGLLTLSYDSDHTLKGIRINKIPKHSTEEDTYISRHTFLPEQAAELKTGPDKTVNPFKPIGIPQTSSNDEPVITTDCSKVNDLSKTLKAKRAFTANEMAQLSLKDEVIQLLFVAEQYLGKSLSSNDTNTILYLYETLQLPADLIDYLLEYCVSKGHRSMRYIEKVALSWIEEHITTIEEAKASAALYNKDSYRILKAFGIAGRQPGESEKAFIVKWTNSYSFSIDLILDACNRTIQTIHQPSFEYADSILNRWQKKGISSLEEVKNLDDEHLKNKEAHANACIQKAPIKPVTKNNFNNFPQHSYNFAELEKQLLRNQ